MIKDLRADIFGSNLEDDLNAIGLGLTPEERVIKIATEETKEIIIAISSLYEPIDNKNMPDEYIASSKSTIKDFEINDPSGQVSEGFLAFMYQVKEQAKEIGVDYTNNKTGRPDDSLVKNFQDLLNANGESRLQDFAKIYLVVGENLKRAGVYQDDLQTPKIVEIFTSKYASEIEEIIQTEQGCVQSVDKNDLLEPVTSGDNCALPQGEITTNFKP